VQRLCHGRPAATPAWENEMELGRSFRPSSLKEKFAERGTARREIV
jgi:hypothetical protein